MSLEAQVRDPAACGKSILETALACPLCGEALSRKRADLYRRVNQQKSSQTQATSTKLCSASPATSSSNIVHARDFVCFQLFDTLRLRFCFSYACMYHQLLQRQRELVAECQRLLRENSDKMDIDTRFFSPSHGYGSGSHSSVSSTGSTVLSGHTGATSVTSSASAATFRSSASSPSLRSRESVVVPAGCRDGVSSPVPGGNVRVVVRVRKFLPRGTFLTSHTSVCWVVHEKVSKSSNRQ